MKKIFRRGVVAPIPSSRDGVKLEIREAGGVLVVTQSVAHKSRYDEYPATKSESIKLTVDEAVDLINTINEVMEVEPTMICGARRLYESEGNASGGAYVHWSVVPDSVRAIYTKRASALGILPIEAHKYHDFPRFRTPHHED